MEYRVDRKWLVNKSLKTGYNKTDFPILDGSGTFSQMPICGGLMILDSGTALPPPPFCSIKYCYKHCTNGMVTHIILSILCLFLQKIQKVEHSHICQVKLQRNSYGLVTFSTPMCWLNSEGASPHQ